jgi:hypothetical protein
MRAVFTEPVTVASDARYAGAGPRRLHLNACGCGRIENIAGRKPATVECARERVLNCSEAGSSKNEDHVGRSRNEDRVGRRQRVERGLIASNVGNPLKTGAGAVS